MSDPAARASPGAPWSAAKQSLEGLLAREFGWAGAVLSAVTYCLFAGVLVAPGTFAVGYMLNDVLTAAESAYRVALDHVPGRDFSSALGVLAYLPHALAYRATGDLLHAMAIGFAVFGGLMLLLACYVAWTRLGLLTGIAVVVTLTLLAMAPWVIGTPVSERQVAFTTAAMFYNRIGFGLVLLTALLVIPPRPEAQGMAARGDLAWGVAAFTLAFYVKMPFGLAVAALFLYRAVLLRKDLRSALLFALGAAAAMLVMEVAYPGLGRAYLSEISLASRASPGVLDLPKLGSLTMKTLPEVIAVAGVPLALLAAREAIRPLDLGYFLCLWGGSILLLSQSAQGPVLVTTSAAAIYAASALIRRRRYEAAAIACALAACGLLPLLAASANAIVRSSLQGARLPPIEGLPVAYRSLRVIEDGVDAIRLDRVMSGALEGPPAFALARSRAPFTTANALPEREFLLTLVHLPAARALCGAMREHTVVLDYTNLSSSLFTHPPAGRFANLHWGRTFSPAGHLPPETLFGGAGCLFEPKLPQSPSTVEGIRVLYGSYIAATYPIAGETRYWRVRVRKPAE